MVNNYKEALYRKNNFGQPCFWEIEIYDLATNRLKIRHGIIGKKTIKEIIRTNRNPYDERISRINAKRKIGYKYLNELKDNTSLPVKEQLLEYLLAYLPNYRTTSDGTMLPMLAKTFDNTNNKLFKRVNYYVDQPKINGLRCLISAEYNQGDMFKPISLKFQSGEGTYWNSLSNLEDYLLHTIEQKVLFEMIENHFVLDGEIYLPGYTVNGINHFVKDPNCPENKLLQYWFYDVCMENANYAAREDWIIQNFDDFKILLSRENHFNNKNRLVKLSTGIVSDELVAINHRDRYIEWGFEGLILRDPYAEYQFGKRNSSMIKFKKSTDGKFKIIDIYPEGIKRKDVPLFLCQNDINDEKFECHISGNLTYQKYILDNKENYIGKYLLVEYGERSGVNQVPFHIKSVTLTNLLD